MGRSIGLAVCTRFRNHVIFKISRLINSSIIMKTHSWMATSRLDRIEAMPFTCRNGLGRWLSLLVFTASNPGLLRMETWIFEAITAVQIKGVVSSHLRKLIPQHWLPHPFPLNKAWFLVFLKISFEISYFERFQISCLISIDFKLGCMTFHSLPAPWIFTLSSRTFS